MKTLFVSVSFILLLMVTSAQATIEPQPPQQQCATIYDNFSEPSLNSARWSLPGIPPFIPPEYTNTTEGSYHVIENENFIMNRPVLPGETVEYDVEYISGTGENKHFAGVSEPYLDISDPQWGWGDLTDIPCPNCFIGFWNNSGGLIGTEYGKYHITMKFTDVYLFLSVQKPDESYWNETLDLYSKTKPPYRLFFSTQTGNNGSMQFDFDNFVIINDCCQTHQILPCNCSELNSRIEALENRVSILESLNTNLIYLYERINYLENQTQNNTQRIDSLNFSIIAIQNSINLLQNGLSAFKSLILSYLSNAPDETRKPMLCGYMKDNNLTEYSDLGTNCEIKVLTFPTKPPTKYSYCVCK